MRPNLNSHGLPTIIVAVTILAIAFIWVMQ